MNATFRALHKYTSLITGLLWLLQAASGTLLSVTDFLSEPGKTATPNNIMMDAGLAAITRGDPSAHIRQIKGIPGEGGFWVYVDRPDHRTDVVRLDEGGRMVDRRAFDYAYPAPGLIQTVRIFHTHLFAGMTGRYILGFSGLLLLSNIVFGLKIAWPRRGQWRRWLVPPRQKTMLMTLLSWHRATGLWLALPALLLIGAGTTLAYDDVLAAIMGAKQPPPHTVLSHQSGAQTRPAQAFATAHALFPNAAFAQMDMPRGKSSYYTVRLRQPGEARETAGMTYVYISARGNSVLRVYDANKAPARVAFITDLYPLHTGEIARTGGRALSILVGLWLLTMGGLGISLWATKRNLRRKKAEAA